MKYQASLPQHNDNVSHEHPLKDFLLILSGLLAIGALAFWLLGHAVDWAVDNLSPEAEARLSQMAAMTLPDSPKQEAERVARVQALVNGMQQCAGLAVRLTEQVTIRNLTTVSGRKPHTSPDRDFNARVRVIETN